MLCRNTSAGRAAGLGCLELLAIGDAAADLFDDGTQRRSHGNLHQAGIGDLTAQGKYLGSFGLLRTHGSKPLGTLEDDPRNVGIGFYVI